MRGPRERACRGARRGEAPRKETTIDDWRARIDDIDAAIVRLLNERADCAIAIGRLKKMHAIPVYQPDRERYVVERVRQLTREMGGRLGPAAIGRLFERIIDEARGLELANPASSEAADDTEHGK